MTGSKGDSFPSGKSLEKSKNSEAYQKFIKEWNFQSLLWENYWRLSFNHSVAILYMDAPIQGFWEQQNEFQGV